MNEPEDTHASRPSIPAPPPQERQLTPLERELLDEMERNYPGRYTRETMLELIDAS